MHYAERTGKINHREFSFFPGWFTEGFLDMPPIFLPAAVSVDIFFLPLAETIGKKKPICVSVLLPTRTPSTGKPTMDRSPDIPPRLPSPSLPTVRLQG